MSGHGTFEMAVRAIKKGALDFIEKPFHVDRLLLSLQRTLENTALRQENNTLRQKLLDVDMLWGQSVAMASLKERLEKVALSNSRILIQGESGTGKGMLAQEIHTLSKRAQGPFVVVSCANLVPELFEGELFGIERTRDGKCKSGFLEQAHGGTLFLSSVQDMPLETQGKILSVLQEQPFQRLGGTRLIHVDVRLISSTSVDLKEAVANGKFREDLYYRLNVVSLRTPPLRERVQDIPELANNFLRKLASQLEMGEKHWHEDALNLIQAYEWPGNIRELKNVVERALILASPDQQILGPDLLMQDLHNVVPSALMDETHKQVLSLPLKEAREHFERQYLFAQVNRFAGNVSRTATFVGMQRSALYRKLRLLNGEIHEKIPTQLL